MIPRIFGLMAAATLMVGCGLTPRPLTEVSWQDAAEAKRILAERRDAIQTVQAECDIRLERGEDRQTFDGAVVMQHPDHYRLRAWKLTQTLFDLTVNDEGVWVAVSDELLKRRPQAEQELAGLAEQLGLLLRGPDFRDAKMLQDEDGQLIARWPQGEAVIDRETLTPRRYEFTDPDSGDSFTVETQYADYAGQTWYREVRVEGGFGSVQLDFRGVHLNESLNPKAFTPPRRAVQP